LNATDRPVSCIFYAGQVPFVGRTYGTFTAAASDGRQPLPSPWPALFRSVLDQLVRPMPEDAPGAASASRTGRACV